MAQKAAEPVPRSRLSRSEIIERALGLLDREGMEAVSFRRLAQELHVTPMALYRHVTGKEDLLDGVADRILEEMELSVDRSQPWTDQLRQLLTSFLSVLAAHPSSAWLFSERTTASPRSLRGLEVLLDVLRRAGFSPAESVHVMRQALSRVISMVAMQPLTDIRGEGRLEAEPESRRQLEGLPADQFPRLMEAVPWLLACEIDEYYRFGIDLFVAGVEAIRDRARGRLVQH